MHTICRFGNKIIFSTDKSSSVVSSFLNFQAMSIRKALSIRKKFTVEQHQFISNQKIDGENTAAVWIDFLEELAEFDSYVDIAKNRIQNAAIICGVLSFISIFIVAFSAGLALPLLILLLLATVIYTSMYFGIKRFDIPNRMRFFIFPLLRVLQEETKPETKIYIKADFHTGMTKPYETKKIEGTYDKVLKKKVDLTFYAYDILQLKTKLADGTSLQLAISDVARKNDIRKTNYRGKTKWKTKYKIKTLIDITLGAKASAYQYIAKKDNEKPQSAIEYTQKEDKHILSLRQVEINTKESSVPKLDIVLSAIATTYQSLKPLA
jgi:hypothetical protein